jgi:hypothetical protein
VILRFCEKAPHRNPSDFILGYLPQHLIVLSDTCKNEKTMLANYEEKKSLTVEKVIDFYQKRGEKISLETAEKVLNLLYFLAKLVVDQHLKQ